MKNKVLKIFISLVLVAIMSLSLFSCGQSVANAQGQWGSEPSQRWEFNASTGTLTIFGSGELPDYSSPEAVSWYNVRSNVTKVSFESGQHITGIGNYSFYGMSKLTEVALTDSVTSIDNAAFAYCTSLKTISLPKNVKFIGAGAFEGCFSLERILVHPAIETICERAFAFCRSLKNVTISGNITALEHWTFKDCTSLDTLVLNESFTTDRFSPTFAEGSNLYSSEISFVEVFDEKATVTVNYLCNGNPIEGIEATKMEVFWGDAYTCTAPAEGIEGYTLIGDAAITGVATKKEIEVNFNYKSIEEIQSTESSTDAATDPAATEDEGVTASTIIGIVIFGIVMIGICVGAFFLVRSGKKQENASSTVRKYDKNGKSKGNKK